MNETLPIIFLGFSVLVVSLSFWRVSAYLGPKVSGLFLVALAVWLGYAAFLAKQQILAQTAFPPRLLLLLVPMIVSLVWLSRSAVGKKWAEAIPLQELIGLQAFRIGVELILFELCVQGLLPIAMTFKGRNFDILIGISAILIYVFWRHLKNKLLILKVWNFIGLAMLANVVITGILSVPGPLQQINFDHPNLAITQFPYVFIPVLFVFQAVGLHILSLRKLMSQ